MRDTIQEQILQAIRHHSITSQEDLQEHLQAQGGLHIPQPTLSRALKRLNIAKIAGVYTLANALDTPLLQSLQSTEHGLLVAHTKPGGASTLAVFLDDKKAELGILGTIAGDDTVLIITESTQEGKSAKAQMLKLFPQAKG